MQFLRDLRPAAFAFAPWTAAILTAAAGVMLLASGATPSEPVRFMRLIQITPVYLIGAAHFLSSILGLALVLLSFGLRARLDGAWYATIGALLLGATLALLKGFNWEETAALVVLALAIAPFHGAFPRTSRLTRMEITPGWLFSAACAVAGAGLLGFWTFQHSDYADRPWWRVMADADAERAVRAWAGAALVLFAFGVWRLFVSAATPPVVGEHDPDYERVRAILAKAEVAEPGSAPWASARMARTRRKSGSCSPTMGGVAGVASSRHSPMAVSRIAAPTEARSERSASASAITFHQRVSE